MNCRKYPPFYEVEQNGVCVKNPPNVSETKPIDYIVTGVFFVFLFGGIMYVINSSKVL